MDKDATYFNFLPLIKNYVLRWANNDSWLKYQNVPLILEDCNSFAFVYWRETLNRLQDNEQASKYYVATVKLKLNSYIKKFYFHTYQSNNDVKEKSTLYQTPMDLNIYTELTKKVLHAEGQIAPDTYCLDKADSIDLEEKILIVLSCFKENYMKSYGEVFGLIYKNCLIYIEGHPKSKNKNKLKMRVSNNGEGAQKILKEMDIIPQNYYNFFARAKKLFKRDFPELVSFLKTGSVEELDAAIEKIFIKYPENSGYSKKAK